MLIYTFRHDTVEIFTREEVDAYDCKQGDEQEHDHDHLTERRDSLPQTLQDQREPFKPADHPQRPQSPECPHRLEWRLVNPTTITARLSRIPHVEHWNYHYKKV